MPQKTIETKNQSPEMSLPSVEHKQLGVWVGKWNTEGQSYAEGNSKESLKVSSVKMTSLETFELLLDGFFLVHRWDGHVGDAEFKGMEVIGYDASSQTYCSRFFDNSGNSPTYQVSVRDNVWTYIGELQRATFEFSDDGNTMTTHWDWKKSDEENCLPLCDLKVTKVK
ncbi:hypothetical protein APA_2135 [Pseudanabaena sp. lw0831]|uniref:DUF1579 family protein n=1 Tax=Pseudanabaena sp. lw0831 TaxID=1357935 RepID=UPI0019154781|nr:DUF1579 family protein [Pseudanabaena sp. lw0831]GBO54187.1 hypothetical protein APA_2135 [Pseudanabaena sp. lw0831]